MLKSPVGTTAQNDVLTEAQLASFLSDVHLADDPQPYFFEEEFKYLHYMTPFFDDGHKRAIYDFLVTGQHRDYFLVTINADMTSFTMKTRASPIFLNIMMRAAGELDRTHPNTNAILAGMHQTTNILVLEVGSDFELVWSEGNVYLLPFKCFPNAHRQLLWHQGCNKLINKRRSSRNLDPQMFHQQTAILHVTFVGVAKQQMGSLPAEDLVIQTPHHSDFLSAGIAPPGQPCAFSGGGGGGGGGSGGFDGGFGGGFGSSFGGGGGGGGGSGSGSGSGFSGHGRWGHGSKAPPQSFGLLPKSTALTTVNAVHQPQVRSGLYAETEHCKLRVRSRSEREKMEVNAAAARMPLQVENVESDSKSESKEILFSNFGSL
jgi:hypothetical protein